MKRSFRVVALTSSRLEGDSMLSSRERYPQNIARAVVQAGNGAVEVSLVSFGLHAKEFDLAPGVRQTILSVAGIGFPSVDTLGWGLEEAVRDASVVHIHEAFTRFGQGAVLAAGIRNVPIVLTDHGRPTLSARAQAELRSVADAVVAYSSFGAKMVGGATANIPGGVDADWFSPPPEGSNRTGFACVGRILPHKRIERVIGALPEGARLVICGHIADEAYAKDLATLAKDCDVVFMRDADEVAVRELYRSVLAVVLLSDHIDRYGNFHRTPGLMGMRVLEAMACGATAVVSPHGALREFVFDGQTGHIVGDDEHLARIMADLHVQPERAAALGEAARAHLVRRWDLPTVGRQMLEVYRQALKARETDDWR